MRVFLMGIELFKKLDQIRKRKTLDPLVGCNIIGWKKELVGSGVEYWFPMKVFGAKKTNSPEVSRQVDILFGAKSQRYKETYQYVLNPEALSSKGDVMVIGGFAPTGNVHLGSYQHLSAGRDIVSPKEILISFNDLEARTIRKISEDEIIKAINVFMEVVDWPVKTEMRTKNEDLIQLMKRFQDNPQNHLIANKICGRKLLKKELAVYNIRAAAYLRHQIQDVNSLELKSNGQKIVAFDGIEELSQLVYINEIAKNNSLPGITAFVSPQIPGFKSEENHKMGKSTPDVSLFASSDLTEKLKVVSSIHLSHANTEHRDKKEIKSERRSRLLLDSIISNLPPDYSLSGSIRMREDGSIKLSILNKYKSLTQEEIYSMLKSLRFGIPFSNMGPIDSQRFREGSELQKNISIPEFFYSLYGEQLTNEAIEIITHFLYTEIQKISPNHYSQTLDISENKLSLLKKRLYFEKKLGKSSFIKKSELFGSNMPSLEESAIKLGFRDITIINPNDDPNFQSFKTTNNDQNNNLFAPRIKLSLENLEISAARSIIENHLSGKFEFNHKNILEVAIKELGKVELDFDNEEIKKLAIEMTARLFEIASQNLHVMSGRTDTAETARTTFYEDGSDADYSVGINLGALKRNIGFFAITLGDVNNMILTVKSFGYGGGYEIAREAYNMGVRKFSVDNMENALILKKQLKEDPYVEILCLYEGYSDNALLEAIDNDITLTVSNLNIAQKINTYSYIRGKKTKVHLYLDTGLHRFGLNPYNHDGAIVTSSIVNIIGELGEMHSLELDGLYTHFANADELDKTKTVEKQMNDFSLVVKALTANNIFIPNIHLANSAAIVNHPLSIDSSYWSSIMPGVKLLSRPGMAVYGMQPIPNNTQKLESIVNIQAKIVDSKNIPAGESFGYGFPTTVDKDSTVIWIAAGYDRGIDRRMGVSGTIRIAGKMLRTGGKINMNFTPIVLKEDMDLMTGDWITLIGEGGLSLDELASQIGTIPQEVMLSLTNAAGKINYYRN